MALVNSIQYDTQSAVIGWQSRFRWILTPGNDLYIVYTHNWLDDPVLNRFATLDKRAASKILHTYRFWLSRFALVPVRRGPRRCFAHPDASCATIGFRSTRATGPAVRERARRPSAHVAGRVCPLPSRQD